MITTKIFTTNTGQKYFGIERFRAIATREITVQSTYSQQTISRAPRPKPLWPESVGESPKIIIDPTSERNSATPEVLTIRLRLVSRSTPKVYGKHKRDF
jgi:hypothetical protein